MHGRTIAVALAVANPARSAVLAGPAQDVLRDPARSEWSARLAPGHASLGLGSVFSLGARPLRLRSRRVGPVGEGLAKG